MTVNKTRSLVALGLALVCLAPVAGQRAPQRPKLVLVLAIDQSGSMADSIVYAGVFASVLASLRSLRTTVVAGQNPDTPFLVDYYRCSGTMNRYLVNKGRLPTSNEYQPEDHCPVVHNP